MTGDPPPNSPARRLQLDGKVSGILQETIPYRQTNKKKLRNSKFRKIQSLRRPNEHVHGTVSEPGAFTGEAVMLTVQECVSFFASAKRLAAHVRTTQVAIFSEVLSVPWIRALPGEKRLRFLYGRLFVIQRYLGVELIRAQVFHGRAQLEDARSGTALCGEFESADSD